MDLTEAEQLTESILYKSPSADVEEWTTVYRVLHSLLESQGIKCLFFDSTQEKNLHDITANLAELDLKDRPFVLKLSNSEGLGDSVQPKTDHDAIRFVETLNDIIKHEQSHSVIDDIRDRLSKVHEVDKEDICIKAVYVGTFNIVYTVKDLTKRAIKSITNYVKKLRDQFCQFVSLKIHPLLFRPAFDISFFDKHGDKLFSNAFETYEIGPPGKTKTYIPPTGWTRYGLKVLGKYQDGDRWLEPFKDPQNWYRAFHGTGRAQKEDFHHSEHFSDSQYASVDAVASIYEKEFRLARVHYHGSGVYCSPDPKFPENGYVTPVELDTEYGKKKFICMLQVAVNPNSVKMVPTDENIWIVPNPQDIRPYGILIKEID